MLHSRYPTKDPATNILRNGYTLLKVYPDSTRLVAFLVGNFE